MSDPRNTLMKDGVAAAALEGLVAAGRYVATTPMQASAATAPIRLEPAGEQADELLFGEGFDVLEAPGGVGGGWAFGQARRTGYVGYVEAAILAPPGPAPTHRVSALAAYAFTGPSMKTAPVHRLSLNAFVAVEGVEGRFARLAGSGWMVMSHLAPLGVFEADPAGVAERYLGVPYLWGGRSSLGLDCSGLVHEALTACGLACPRDSDQQMAVGHPLAGANALRRGDLVFWRGHVGMMLDAHTLLHANAHAMCVAREPLAEAMARIEANGYGPPTGFRRV